MAAAQRIDCAICGKSMPLGRSYRSKKTGRRFCADVGACERRKMRQRRAEKKAA